eukprot:g5627.t1
MEQKKLSSGGRSGGRSRGRGRGRSRGRGGRGANSSNAANLNLCEGEIPDTPYRRKPPHINVPGKLFPIKRVYISEIVGMCKREGIWNGPHPASLWTRLHEAKRNQSRWKTNLNRRVSGIIDPRELVPYALIVSCIEYICLKMPNGHGATLVFLPGWGDIEKVQNLLERSALMNQVQLSIFTLHSQMKLSLQRQAFEVTPKGVCKIVLATNIAETSITIPDIVYVIDTGMHKQRQFEALETVAISASSCRQREGRAGRLQAGIVYKLYSHADFRKMIPQNIPAIRRVPLTELCLLLKRLPRLVGSNVEEEEEDDDITDNFCLDVFQHAIDPPSQTAVEDALSELRKIGALDQAERLTPLGKIISRLPIEARLGKMLVIASILGCSMTAATLAALTGRDPFIIVAIEDRSRVLEVRRQFDQGWNSDHVVALKAFQGWLKASVNSNDAGFYYCEKNFLSERTMQNVLQVRDQLLVEMQHVGLMVDGEGNRHGDNMAVLKGVVTAALQQNILRYKDSSISGGGKQKFINNEDCSISLHPSSVVGHTSCDNNDCTFPWAIYTEKKKTSSTYLINASAVNSLSLALFVDECVPFCPVKMNRKSDVGILLSGWGVVVLERGSAVACLKLRQAVRALIKSRILSIYRKEETKEEKNLVNLVANILLEQERKCGAGVKEESAEKAREALLKAAGHVV